MERYQDLLGVAEKLTGLHEYGPDSFREGLEILVNAINREAQLNATGEHVLRDRIVGHLQQRLQVEDWYRRHPEIDDEEIVRPLIGLSLPRTGSTALSFLLAQDPNARSLLRGEAANPCPPPSTGNEDREQGMTEAETVAGWKSHTPTGDNAPAECQDLMALDFKSHIFQAFAQIPSYSRWLYDADLSSTYLYERKVLKLLQWGLPQKPWRLKAPTHLIYLNHLNSAFPDARFVMTHRDPSQVIPSVIDVYADIVGRFTEHMDTGYLAELNIHQWSGGMKRALAFRRQGDNDTRFFDIHFKAMHEDPVAEVTKLYEWLGEPVTPAFARGMADWWQQNAANREPATSRRVEDYGLNPDQVRSLFADYSRSVKAWTGKD